MKWVRRNGRKCCLSLSPPLGTEARLLLPGLARTVPAGHLRRLGLYLMNPRRDRRCESRAHTGERRSPGLRAGASICVSVRRPGICRTNSGGRGQSGPTQKTSRGQWCRLVGRAEAGPPERHPVRAEAGAGPPGRVAHCLRPHGGGSCSGQTRGRGTGWLTTLVSRQPPRTGRLSSTRW